MKTQEATTTKGAYDNIQQAIWNICYDNAKVSKAKCSPT
jgi:hypothetical protein